MKTTGKIIFIILILILGASCTNDANNIDSVSNGGVASPQRLIVGIMPDLDSIPFVVAQEQGFLPDNVTLEIFKSPVDRDSALMSGGLDGTISDMLAVALAQNGGFDAYATSKTDGRYAVLAGKDTGITSAAQLSGKEVGMSLNTIIEYVTDRIVDASGVSGVSKVSVPQIPSRLELLESGQIDAIAVPEPFVTAAATAGAIILNTSSEMGVNPAVMLFTGEAIEKKSGELIEMYEAYDRAVEYINATDKNEFMPQVIQRLGLPENAINVELPGYSTMTLPDKSETDMAVEWLLKKGLLDNKLEYDDLIREIK